MRCCSLGEGARVVVNDTGGGNDGSPTESEAGDPRPAEEVAAEIRDAGGEAIGVCSDAADWEGARVLVEAAIDAYGGVDILVNNAGILRDRLVVNMTESEWDDVIRVHLRGHFCPTHHVAAYWRDEHKAGGGRATEHRQHVVDVRVCSPTQGRATTGRRSRESPRSPRSSPRNSAASTSRSTASPRWRARASRWRRPGLDDIMAVRDGMFDEWDPANVAPVVAYLASAACRFNGETFFVRGGTVQRVRSWELAESVRCDGAWSVDELTTALDKL